MSGASDVLVSEAQVICPDCGEVAHLGVRGRGVLISNCSAHGVYTVAVPGTRPDAGRGSMDCEERLWLISSALARFMVDPDADDFMAIQSSTLACNQLLLRFGEGRFWAEVDCREWNCTRCGNRPLSADALERIGKMGFYVIPGAPNPANLAIPRDPWSLAVLVDNAMLAAYDEPADYEVGVYFKRTAVMRDVVAQLQRAGA